MLGKAAVAMWWDVAPDMKAEFEDWHTHEHMPERLAIPGFLRGTRWIAASGEPSYFVLYEVAGLATLTAGPYLERLNDPTPGRADAAPSQHGESRARCAQLRAGVAPTASAADRCGRCTVCAPRRRSRRHLLSPADDSTRRRPSRRFGAGMPGQVGAHLQL
jgi:hypothetical protein